MPTYRSPSLVQVLRDANASAPWESAADRLCTAVCAVEVCRAAARDLPLVDAARAARQCREELSIAGYFHGEKRRAVLMFVLESAVHEGRRLARLYR